MKNIEKLVQKLTKTGIPCSKMRAKKSDPFLIENNTKRKGIKVHCPESVKVKVYPNKTKKQAVLAVTEPQRTFEETVWTSGKISGPQRNEVYTGGELNTILSKGDLNKLKEEVDKFRTFSLHSTFEIIEVQIEGIQEIHCVDIKVTAPAITNYFLCGFDEKHTFICQLPEAAKSVKQAHEVLKPEGWKENWVRVGEYFFAPVDDKYQEELYSGGIHLRDEGVTSEIFPNGPQTTIEEVYSENHVASLVTYPKNNYKISKDLGKNKTFVAGAITDTRKTHEPVVLGKWHQVIRNREVINNSGRWD